jgi:two-component system cell cycle response regulator
MNSSRTALTARRVAAAAGIVALVGYLAHAAVGLGGHRLDGFFGDWVYDGMIVGAAVACLVRAATVRLERWPWLVLGIGVAAWGAGEIHYSLVISKAASPPFPSIGDALYLLFYPASYATLVMLVRARVPIFQRSLWLDGAIGALAVAAVAAAVAFEPILAASGESGLAVAVNLAYPLGDLLLLAFVVGIFGLTGWRPGRDWLLLGAALVLGAGGDVAYLYESATGTYAAAGVLDATWPASALALAWAAWQRPSPRERMTLGGHRMLVVPAVCGLAAIVLRTVDHFERLNDLSAILATGALVIVIVRMALTFRENLGMLAKSRDDALTDALTGLGNRRRLMVDLDRELRHATVEDPRVLILFDLEFFKRYNDVYGHPAGDALLARLGGKLAAAVEPFGHAYRMGGDEFCAIVRAERPGIDTILTIAVSALSERGEGFEVAASYGTVVFPHEAGDASHALQIADQRMYAQKAERPASVNRQTRDVLLQVLQEREPDLHEHLQGVADLALAVGRRLGMTPDELDVLARAAELHDVGKMAIPDAILNKPGALDEEEWAFMRRHTIFGERILSAAPALLPVAKLVRASHERWDGDGYPDRLVENEIPLGARIIAVCDAFHAMISNRPYRQGISMVEAVAELRRCAGRQFDPTVVKAFCEAFADWSTRDAHGEPVFDRSRAVTEHIDSVLTAALESGLRRA